MVILPKEKLKATRVNPKSIVIFSQPKMGKTTILSGLDNCLIIDLEEGTDFVDALKIDVLKLARQEKELPIIVLQKIINKIEEENEKKGGYVYKFIAIDTVTALKKRFK